MDNKSLKKLEADLWESADLLRADSKLTSNQYCMPVLGLLFLRYAYGRFKRESKPKFSRTARVAVAACFLLNLAILRPRVLCSFRKKRNLITW